MKNLSRSREGYLLIDHRATGIIEGVTSKIAEYATLTCSHCHKQLIINPARNRERSYCPKCDHYICDECNIIRVASGYICMQLTAVFDQIRNRSILAAQRSR